ncbi:glutamate-1-semialdehyde 2,1-aminomutase (plasmid) [Candidatus Photodesmus katoptron]|uniref:glutamate-1-semialdehyde 2,1-aminomutase n=1 Tax=Candidatus Photodesmus anomalopis TaxID=28176 RepID=UPI0004D99412|nr:glutamate-1-semialdehyde 2,1-aminomutase [Candidatus Photodesmus katoptron]KEY90054.1 glutamate-1-semialdehyde 2,1-aminomutase [Candidatus Photodesmus katoptron]
MTQSHDLYLAASRIIPGGVNSPVRAFTTVNENPIFIKKGNGAYLFDVDGNSYIDYVNSWGAIILGHNHPEIRQAIISSSKHGISFGAPTEIEIKIGNCISSMIPSMEMIRMVNSGTEATMSAIRLARGYTKKNKFIKFSGCYHGHADHFLIKSGSGPLTLGIPSSSGIPSSYLKNTLICEFNNIDSVKSILEVYGEDIACIIIEPVAGNMGCILPKEGFLTKIRKLCTEYNILLVFDEVITGFRVSLGGAQELYNVKPDLTTLGKIIGGGLSIGAFGGKREIMEHISPLGKVYQAGTLSGNPIAMSAGLSCLEFLKRKKVHKLISDKTEQLVNEIIYLAKINNIPLSINHVTGMFSLFFTEKKVYSLKDIRKSDFKKFQKFFSLMLKGGIYLAPSAYEASFISLSHNDLEINKTLDIVNRSFKSL